MPEDWNFHYIGVDFRTNFYALRMASSIRILHMKARKNISYEILIKFQHAQIRGVLYNTVSILTSFLISTLSPESFNFNTTVFFFVATEQVYHLITPTLVLLRDFQMGWKKYSHLRSHKIFRFYNSKRNIILAEWARNTICN